ARPSPRGSWIPVAGRPHLAVFRAHDLGFSRALRLDGCSGRSARCLHRGRALLGPCPTCGPQRNPGAHIETVTDAEPGAFHNLSVHYGRTNSDVDTPPG